MKVVRLGIEEEVFVLDNGRINLDGFFTLACLLFKRPAYYYTHTASNLARGADLRKSFLASVEISTSPHYQVQILISELSKLRSEFCKVCPGSIVACGMLPHLKESPSIVSALQIHVSGVKDKLVAYETFLYFAPALLLITANSPAVDGRYVGLCARVFLNPFIGVPSDDPRERYSDVIISRRLGTVELRLFDPCPDIERVRFLAEAVYQIADQIERGKLKKNFDREKYAILRERAAKVGIEDREVYSLAMELSDTVGIDISVFENPPALKTWKLFSKEGVGSYKMLDEEYRQGNEYSCVNLPYFLRAGIGIFGYYLPRLPYTAYKFLREHGYI